MGNLTTNDIYKSALITGLKLFGIPNISSSYDWVTEEMKIDISKFNQVLGTGLIYNCFYLIIEEKASERIKYDLDGALENFLYIGDYEYIFYPHSPDKEVKDFSCGRLLLNEDLRDVDGKVYTAEGEGSHINIITIDITFEEAMEKFEEETYNQRKWYSVDGINELRNDILSERR